MLDEEFDPSQVRRGRGTPATMARAAAATPRGPERFSDHAVMDEILAHVDDTETASAAFNPSFSSSRYERGGS